MKTKLCSFCLKSIFVIGLLFSFFISNAQTPISTWTYDSVQGTVSNPTPNFGTGTSSVVNLVITPSTAQGLSSTTGCGSANSGLGWQHLTFDPGSTNEVNGVRYNSATSGFTNIYFTWDQRFSNASPNTVRLQYTLDGSTWTNFTMTGVNTTICAGAINTNGCYETNTGDSFRRIRVNLTSIAGANNNANFGVRLLASQYQSTGQYRKSTTPTIVATNTGTWRFDNVSFLGTPTTTGAVLSGSATICPSATANINVTITGGVSPYTVVYTNGSSNFTVNSYTSGSNIAVSPASTTTYTLVSVKDNTNATISPLSGSAVVTVNAGVSPSFIASPGATSCASTNIVYTTQAGNDNYAWTFLNGASPAILGTDYNIVAGSTATETVTIQWLLASGSAVFSATATYSTCSGASVTSSTTVYALPTVTFTSQPGSTACTNTNVTYTTQSGQSTYTWVPSGTAGTNYTVVSGGTSTDNTYTIKWLTSGGTVSVNYTNSNGCTASAATTSTAITTLNALPVVTFTTAPAATICSSTAATYTTQSGRSNYIWVVPGVLGTDYTISAGGISTSDYTVTLTWLTSGSKTVTVNYNSAAGCAAASPTSNTTAVTVAPGITSLSPLTQTTCQGTAFSPLTVNTTGPVPTYQWYSNTTNTNSGGTAVPNANGGKTATCTPLSPIAGTFYFYVKVTGCSIVTSSCTGAYNVIATPTITSTFAVSSLCTSSTPQSATLSYTATTSSPTSYSIVWNAAAITAGFTNQATTPLTFSSGAGTITGITIPANLAPNQYTGNLIVTNVNSCNSVPNVITINVGKQWNGATSSDWGIASNWTPSGVPTSSDCVVIPNGTPNSPVIAANAFAANLTVNTTASLTVNAGFAIEVQDFVKTDGTFTINNNASLVQINNVVNSGSGNMIYKRDVTGLHGYDYVYWSSPVASQPINNLYSTPALGYKYYWDTLVDNGNGTGANISQGNWAAASGNMSVGKGYIIRGSTSYGWTGTLTSTFTGIPNNGNITVPIARGAYQGTMSYIGVNGANIYNTDDNMNLIGNPYPSAVRVYDFLDPAVNSDIDGYVYLWSHNSSPSSTTNPFYSSYSSNYFTSDYITYNRTGPSSGPATFNGYIAAGQGFFVSMINGPADVTKFVTFTNTMRSKTYSNSQFFKSGQMLSTADNNHRIWVDLIDSTNQSTRTLVGYCEGATNLKDRNFDAFTKVSNANILYSLIGNESQVIQGRAFPFDVNDQVSLGYHAQAAGNFTIAIAAVDGLFEQGQPIYLEDKVLNVIYDLRQAPYVFASAQGTFNDRFVLRYTNAALSNANFSNSSSSVVIYKSDNFITVKSDKTAMNEIMVYDIQSRLLNDFKNLSASEFQFVAPLEKQVLLIKIIASDNSIIFRKFSN